ncbi:hypothetical protein RM863_35185 [Streptomyces sp. DSM 41014]|uniref:Uncharacterized protein n=1 Tax=Streptomyces hintoniae TaxID=3075521 RepID=A0ABU2UVS1_9ACTN|nr:hypothetical protein [Streptomyces sp. DSM 41014]MDT0477379.1 hypothetical protein [Streptomyces sp. DSM 41014]
MSRSRLARPADRLARGTYLAARRRLERTASWIARARRDDLTGWRAALGCWARVALLALGVVLVARLIRALPALMWLLSGVWLVAAWRAGKPAPSETPAEPSEKPSGEAPVMAPGEALRALLLEVMGEADAVHLSTVLAHLQETGHWRGRTVTDLRRRLAALGVPHDRSVKVAGVPTWGVRRKHLQEGSEAPSPAPFQETSPEASTAA